MILLFCGRTNYVLPVLLSVYYGNSKSVSLIPPFLIATVSIFLDAKLLNRSISGNSILSVNHEGEYEGNRLDSTSWGSKSKIN